MGCYTSSDTESKVLKEMDWSVDGGDALPPLKATVLVDGNHRTSAMVREGLELV